MVAIKLGLLLFLNILYVTDCKRRITNGQDVTAEKGYMVYLIKASKSDKVYDEWLCGGALVTTLFIVTSAACVVDVEYMYAIAGYKKYVKDSEVETDGCTQQKKKKVIYTCVPMKYHLDYHKTETWSFIDIALVKVESPYDLDDTSYQYVCSYKPAVIPINYNKLNQEPGKSTVTFGWGHPEYWREVGDRYNYNMEYLQFASAKIINNTECQKQYEQYPGMNEIIDQYMICTQGSGVYSDSGEIIQQPNCTSCNPSVLRGPDVEVTGYYKTGTDEDSVDNITTFEDILIGRTRRRDEIINKTTNVSVKKRYKNRTRRIIKNRTVSNSNTGPSRKNGICQNDHGGPLVTWYGGVEMLIGVASVFKVVNNLKCEGPYLFTSTTNSRHFLQCILNDSNLQDTKRRARCNSPPIQRGYDIVERYISWAHHPSGPAENERNNAKAERDERGMRNPRAMENLARISMLSKMAKDHVEKLLRQGRPTQPRI